MYVVSESLFKNVTTLNISDQCNGYYISIKHMYMLSNDMEKTLLHKCILYICLYTQ